jgi:protein-tyrosine phosphatase
MTRVLFVCLGNICRSPLAHGLFREAIRGQGLQDKLKVDSCGTSSFHNGGGADPNSVQVASDHGVDLGDMVSRQLVDSDFFEFDLMVAMDRRNHADIQDRCPPNSEARVVRFMDFVPNADSPDVPDPYYGGYKGFERMYELIDAGIAPLITYSLELDGELHS